MSVFEQEECSLHVNGVDINKDFNGYQYTLLVANIEFKQVLYLKVENHRLTLSTISQKEPSSPENIPGS